MHSKLSDISRIITGYSFRGSIQPTETGTPVLQAKDITSAIVNDITALTKTALSTPDTRSVIHKNDVLLTSRGASFGAFRAATFDLDTSKVLAASSIHIIRPDTKKILPQYLTHYLNSFYGQKEILQIARGSRILNVPLNELQDLSIPVPSLEKQKTVINLSENLFELKELNVKKNRIFDNLSSALFNELALA